MPQHHEPFRKQHQVNFAALANSTPFTASSRISCGTCDHRFEKTDESAIAAEDFRPCHPAAGDRKPRKNYERN